MTAKLNYNQGVPGAPEALGDGYGYATQSGLPTERVDFVPLRDPHTNNCARCLEMHTCDLVTNVVKVRRPALVSASKASGSSFGAAESATRVAETMAPGSA
jgi:AhpD family alkylhydroperoxidase